MINRTDLLFATRLGAPMYEACFRYGEESPFSETHVSSHVTDLESGFLWTILERQPWDPDKHTLMSLSSEDEGDTWLNRFPDQVTELLAPLDDKGADKALVRWGATEELPCDPDGLRPGITALRTLARSALRQDKAVFLWGAI